MSDTMLGGFIFLHILILLKILLKSMSFLMPST